MDVATIVPFIISVLGSMFSCGFAVVSHHFSKKTASSQLQSDVDDLIFAVEKLAKTQRREKMTNVRAAAEKSDSKDPQSNLELIQGGSVQRRSKAELRAIVMNRKVK